LRDWAQAAFDTKVIEAETHIPQLIDEWEKLKETDANRAEKLSAAVTEMKEWNHISTVDSKAMTLFFFYAIVIRATLCKKRSRSMVRIRS
jgi:hypothetical protein